eukprot:1449507-Rhodomonas_salina.5
MCMIAPDPQQRMTRARCGMPAARLLPQRAVGSGADDPVRLRACEQDDSNTEASVDMRECECGHRRLTQDGADAAVAVCCC